MGKKYAILSTNEVCRPTLRTTQRFCREESLMPSIPTPQPRPRLRHPDWRPSARAEVSTSRRGSVLLVMLALLLLLMVLGFTAFTFTAQEHESAKYYAGAAQRTGIEVDSNLLFDFGLEQLLLGPNERNYQSALWPGRHSLIPNMLGMFAVHPDGTGRTFALDRHPYNGVGVNLVVDPISQNPFVDNNRDGLPDADGGLYWNWNYSPASRPDPNQPPLTRDQILLTLAAPDVDYTYPDINNVFLAQFADVRLVYNDPTSIVPVIIPSFHRPQYLRSKFEGGDPLKPRARPDLYPGNQTWAEAPQTVGQVLRPHPNHVVVTLDATGKPFYPKADQSGPFYRRFPKLQAGFDLSPPDPDADGVPREQGLWSLSGTITAADPRIKHWEYDVDNRGSGVRDGIWLDLGHSPFFLPDGRGVVPLWSFTVLAADGLVNFNTAGNLSALAAGMTTEKSDLASLTLSRSNAGRSVSEINPFWALTADPKNSLFLNPPLGSGLPLSGDPLFQHVAFQKYNTSSEKVISRVELANLELLFSQWGRPDFTSSGGGGGSGGFNATEVVPGRYGDESLVLPGWNVSRADPMRWLAFPRPGVPLPSSSSVDLTRYLQVRDGRLTGIPGDDDLNNFEGRAVDDTGESTRLDQHPAVAAAELSLGTRVPLGTGPQALLSQGHPSDFSGVGDVLVPSAGGLTRRLQSDPNNAQSPIRWPTYQRYSRGSQWETLPVNGLTGNSNALGLLDHPSEMIQDHRYRTPGLDQPFLVDELFHLHASPADFSQANSYSRLRRLLPFNLDSNLQAQQIRQRFTTSSWDRSEHSQSWSADPRSAWEFNADLDGDGLLEFPPIGGTPQLPVDIFRSATRAWIGCEVPGTQWNPLHEQTRLNPLHATRNQQRRLDLNRLATVADRRFPPQIRTSAAPQITENPIRFRRLTPHPITSQFFNSVPDRSADAGPTYEDPLVQEFWARRDRQEMARDIYTLLFTLCGGDPATGTTWPTYVEGQLIELAQFAVNVVDELDPDNTITRFEFDVNLSNGWNLDDNVDTIDPQDRTLPSGEPAVVYGVEAQLLTFSEVLSVHQPKTNDNSNHPATPHDDGASDRWFTHVELQNVSPSLVGLSNGGWRLSLANPTAPLSRAVARSVKRTSDLRTSVIFRRDALNNSSRIEPGARYTLATAGRNDGQLDTFAVGGQSVVRSADLRMDLDSRSTTQFSRVSPMVQEANPPGPDTDAPPGTNLDLLHGRDEGRSYFQLLRHTANTTVDATNDPSFRGGFLRGSDLNPGQMIVLFLERRADLNRVGPSAGQLDPIYESDNPWITVDHFVISISQLVQITNSTMSTANIARMLQNLGSTERNHPLIVMESLLKSQGVAAWPVPQLPNTIGLGNSRALVNNSVWQPHFDRDFDSVMDLLRVPLYGPQALTMYNSVGSSPLIEYNIALGNRSTFARDFVPVMGAAKFLQPTNRFGVALANNRWYRLLDLFEVPSLGREIIATRFPQVIPENVSRVPGRLQLNAITHPENLFALLDDPRGFTISATAGAPERIVDSLEVTRDWWNEFTRTRDGLDPILQLPLPGNPSARPFRSFAHSPTGTTKPELLEHTRLRRLALDAAANNPVGPFDDKTPTQIYGSGKDYRRLWEARSLADKTNSTVDPVSSHRLLGKVVNNSSTRSHVFMVWMTVGFFDAIFPEPQNPTIVQVGQELEDQPRRRGFFVVDRSLIEDAVVPASQPGQPPLFDFRKFIQYRRELR
jgi:hypothetical protein